MSGVRRDRNIVPQAPADCRKVPLGSCQAILSPMSPPNPGSSSWPVLSAVSAVGAPPSRGTSHSWLPALSAALQLARISVALHHRPGEQLASGIGDASLRTTVPSLRTNTNPAGLLYAGLPGTLPGLTVPSTSWVPSGDCTYSPPNSPPSWSVGKVSCGLPARSTRFSVPGTSPLLLVDSRRDLPSGRV